MLCERVVIIECAISIENFSISHCVLQLVHSTRNILFKFNIVRCHYRFVGWLH